MLSEKMLASFNDQINKELYSEYYYMSMSAWCSSNDLPGMAAFMMKKSSEERDHAMKIYSYIHNRDGQVVLQGLKQPQVEFASFMDIFQKQLDHEKEVTRSIHTLYELALQEKDYPSQVMLQWFVEEQVEEEKEALDIVNQCKRIGENQSALFLLDKRIGTLAVAK